MQRLAFFLFACSIALASAAEPKVKIGDTIADLRFKDIRGLQRALSDFGSQGLGDTAHQDRLKPPLFQGATQSGAKRSVVVGASCVERGFTFSWSSDSALS